MLEIDGEIKKFGASVAIILTRSFYEDSNFPFAIAETISPTGITTIEPIPVRIKIDTENMRLIVERIKVPIDAKAEVESINAVKVENVEKATSTA